MLLGEAMGAKVTFSWRPFLERGLTRQTFDAGMCDVMIDIPAPYGSLLTTIPIYRTTYVLAYRNDKGLDIKGFDDPRAQEAEDWRVPDLRRARGSRPPRHCRQCLAAVAPMTPT